MGSSRVLAILVKDREEKVTKRQIMYEIPNEGVEGRGE